MNILHISTFDKKGGAAIAAFRMHTAMRNAGIASQYLVLHRSIVDRPDITAVSRYKRYTKHLMDLISESMRCMLYGFTGMFSSFRYGLDISKRQEIIDADIIYIHWVCRSFLNYKTLKKILKTRKLIFWFMHDMFPITGGCFYAMECIRYYTQCGGCTHRTGKSILSDLAGKGHKKKKELYRQYANLSFIVPSKWLYECAMKSSLMQGKMIYYIPNMIDPHIFKPMNRESMRSLFSLENGRKYIGFGADSALTNPFKGWVYLREALHILSKDEAVQEMSIVLIIFGSSYNKEIASALPFESIFLGQLHDEYSLAALYNCLDVFVISSVAENCPQTVLESLASNTAVAGFAVGGIPEMVNNNTGYLADFRNSDDLASGIALLLEKGRKDVRSHIDSFFTDAVLERHRALWKTIPMYRD